MPPIPIPAPVLQLASSPDIITYIAATHTLTHDTTTGRPLHTSTSSAAPPVADDSAVTPTPTNTNSVGKKPKQKSKSKTGDKKSNDHNTHVDLKSKSIRLVATGYVPFGKPLGGEQSVEPVVAVITEDKWVRLIQAETGKVFYERTLIKKASAISVEEDGTVIVSDKNGDVFAYPFVDDTHVSLNVPKPDPASRPDPVALAGDPSLNPDAKLILGHVSANTAHLVTYDKNHIITADRDEHVRVSRYPEGYVLVRFLFGHKQFVSSLCIPESHPEILLSAGGDPNILIHSWQTGHLLRQIPILPELSPFRTVRTVMRRGGKRVRQALIAEEEKLVAEGKADEVERMRREVEDALDGGKGVKMKGLTDEEWRTPTRGWVLPEGDGICVARMEMVGQNVVFFSEGCSSIHSIPIEHVVAPVSVLSAVHTLALPCPVLDFCVLPAHTTTGEDQGQTILLSTDPAWEHRQDGGKSFFPNNDGNAWTKSKKRSRQANKNGAGQDKATEGEGTPAAEDVVMDEEEAASNAVTPVAGEETRDLAGYTEAQIEEMSRSPFRVVRVQDDGSMQDVTSSYTDFLKQFSVPQAPVDQVLAIPAYNNLTFFPKWQTEEDEDEPDLEAAIPILADKSGNNRKRALGRLKARGVDVTSLRTKVAGKGGVSAMEVESGDTSAA